MKPREVKVLTEKRLLDAAEVCMYLGLGRNKGIEFAKSIGAERKIGRRCLYDKAVIDRILDDMKE
ncbi:polyprenyl synthetase solanesyl diphosphate synthase [Lactonifactor longoviformis]|uniref:polyprenyl synthetase solanesyl diphosphate synthase n=1 Tax=Lactonifactor longoviformis TaxID=341220 RepID=UPI00210AA82C|nr:polyprenyl synthetase solanesyl diphosphate synthase [Lactonifactor longoviformis]MCQ4672441.1 polyprenyl synthetase solanesyl diphosphate synthase [Lactonifactor longoviformis]